MHKEHAEKLDGELKKHPCICNFTRDSFINGLSAVDVSNVSGLSILIPINDST